MNSSYKGALILAFIVIPLASTIPALSYFSAKSDAVQYHQDQRVIVSGTIQSVNYHSGRGGSYCAVTISTPIGDLQSDLDEPFCFRQVFVHDSVNVRVWRNKATYVWDGNYSFWTYKNPDDMANRWFPIMIGTEILNLGVIIWASIEFVLNRRRKKLTLS